MDLLMLQQELNTLGNSALRLSEELRVHNEQTAQPIAVMQDTADPPMSTVTKGAADTSEASGGRKTGDK